MKTLIRDLLATGLHSLRVTDPARWRTDRLYIATFHRVLPEELRRLHPLPGLVVTPDELEWFVRLFQQWFLCQRLDDAWRALTAGDPSERPRLAVTFDDGSRDSYVHAAPILERLGVLATFFVPVAAVENQQVLWHDRLGYAIQRLELECPQSPLLTQLGLSGPHAAQEAPAAIGRAKQWSEARRLEWLRQADVVVPDAIPAWDGTMTWQQLRELSQRGHEIGSHSYTHPILVRCNDRQLEREAAESRRRLEQELGASVQSFCYPNGDHDPRVVGVVKRAGYQLAVTTRWGSNGRTASAFALKRLDMVKENSLDRRGRLSTPRVAMRMAGFARGLN